MSLPETIVLSLPNDTARRDHIRRHFEAIGIENYRFANAIAADSDLVSLWEHLALQLHQTDITNPVR
jgi:GR25 family glycosyltransferase involved in LPS biosynthesis